MYAVVAALAAVTPTPSPAPSVDPALVTPGPWGFAIMAFIAAAVVLLMWDMQRRIRRSRYRAEVAAELDAEEQAARGVAATEVDEQDVAATETDDPGAAPGR